MGLKRDFNLLIAATLLLYLVQGCVIFLLWHSNRARSQEGKNAHNAICVLVEDYQQRIKSEQLFLFRHPSGIDGITPADIINNIHNQKRTLQSLKTADCP